MTTTVKRRRFTPAVIATGALGSIVMALSMNGTLAAFAAKIDNTNNFTSLAKVALEEYNEDGTTGGGNNCTTTVAGTAADCSTINKFGGGTASDTATDTIIQMQNKGDLAISTFKVWGDVCESGSLDASDNFTADATQPTTDDICDKLQVTVYESEELALGAASGDVTTWTAKAGPVSLNGFTKADFANGFALSSIAKDQKRFYKFSVVLPSGTDAGAAAGKTAKQTIHWEAQA